MLNQNCLLEYVITHIVELVYAIHTMHTEKAKEKRFYNTKANANVKD